MPNPSNRLTVTLDEDSIDLLKRLQAFTKLTPAATVAILFPAHLEELWEYLTWMEQLPDGPSQLRSRGVHLLHSYGPQSLIEGIAQLDPTYKTEGQRFADSLKKTPGA